MKSRTLRYTESKHPLSKIPFERLAEMQSILHDRQTISVYCDCSTIPDQEVAGVGVCFVGDGETKVESKKLYMGYVNVPMYAELKAVSFAVSTLPKILGFYSRRLVRPERIIIYSDCDHIERLLYTDSMPRRAFMREAVSDLRQLLAEISKELKGYDLMVSYIGTEKKHNVYFSAAHNSARRVLGKK
ncbi:hypothetical protein M0651_07475 [Paenibacillus sp. MBLB2552]|uniref:Uncharacterized protein n=1 Tax=Paenibacillus mellifer TaxID=2937794 RepID=A0A9X1XWS2_9BACL|nr:hypothetical protein [Paenibacillus mellifer]MCK8487005.1 hypothetical protein [Paenibacillus mellifer]